MRLLDVAGAVDGRAELHLGGIGVVLREREGRHGTAGQRELAGVVIVARRVDGHPIRSGIVQGFVARGTHCVRRRAARPCVREVLGVVLGLELVTRGAGVAHVTCHRPAAARPLAVQAGRENLVVGDELEVADQRQHRAQSAGDRGVLSERRIGDTELRNASAREARWIGVAARRRVAGNVHLDAARVVLLVALGVVEIEDAGEGVHRAELERRHRAVAGVLTHVGAHLHAGGREYARAVCAPGLVGAVSLGRERRVQPRKTEREPHLVVGVLVDVGEAHAIALVGRIRAQTAVGIALAAHVESQRTPAVLERAHRAQLDGSGEPLADEPRVRGLVDDDRAQEFRRVLIELDAAVVAGTHLLAAVEERRGEARIRAAQADRRGAAFGTL